MRDTPRMDIFAACCVPVFVKSLKEVFFLVQESKVAWQKRCIYLFPQNVPNTLPAWVSWAVVSSFSQLQEDTHRHTLNHVAAKWQQTHICILLKGRMCIYIYIFMSHISYIYIHIFIYADAIILYIYVCVVPKIFGHDMRFHFAPILFRVLRTVVSCFPCFVLSKKFWADAATDLRILH